MAKQSNTSSALQIMKAVRQLNPLETQREALQDFKVALVGETEAQIAEMRDLLLGESTACSNAPNPHIIPHLTSISANTNDIKWADIVLVYAGTKVNTDECGGSVYTYSNQSPATAIRQILSDGTGSNLRLALGAQFPGLRMEAARAVIREISMENAVLAVTTALGTVIPTIFQPIMGVAEGVGDITVLTSNQIRMMFMIGAIYNAEVGFINQWKELSSIVGSAFGWRAIARELVGVIPFGGGLVPKGAIAYAGTAAIGEGLIFFYTTGRRMTRAETNGAFRKAYSDSVELVRSFVDKLRPSSPDADGADGSDTDGAGGKALPS